MVFSTFVLSLSFVAGNTQRNVLVAILGVGLAALAADRLFSDAPLTGPQAAEASSTDALATAPQRSAHTRVLTVQEQLATAAAQVGFIGPVPEIVGPQTAMPSSDPLLAPEPWVQELLAAVQKREQPATQAADPAKPKPCTIVLVGVLVEKLPNERTIAVVRFGESAAKSRSERVAVGDTVDGFRVVEISPKTAETPATITLERDGQLVVIPPPAK